MEWFKSEAFILLSRVSMIVATSVFLPLVGWMGVRALEKLDTAASKVETLSVKNDDWREQLAREFRIVDGIMMDHETRIRSLERPTPR